MTDKPTPPAKPAVESTPEELRLHPILSNADVAKAKKQARAAIEDERKKQAMDALIAQETMRLQQEEAFTPDGSEEGQLVNITLNLVPFQPNITMDGRVFFNGRTYPVPRRVARTMQEIIANGWRHEHNVKEENLQTFYGTPHRTTISPVKGVANAPMGPA